jgi:hypothetical protein
VSTTFPGFQSEDFFTLTDTQTYSKSIDIEKSEKSQDAKDISLWNPNRPW